MDKDNKKKASLIIDEALAEVRLSFVTVNGEGGRSGSIGKDESEALSALEKARDIFKKGGK